MKIAACNLIFVIKIDIRYLCVGYVLVWGAFVERQKNKSKDQSAANNKEKRHIKSVQLEKNSIMVILYHDGYLIFSNIRDVQNLYDILSPVKDLFGLSLLIRKKH